MVLLIRGCRRVNVLVKTDILEILRIFNKRGVTILHCQFVKLLLCANYYMLIFMLSPCLLTE